MVEVKGKRRGKRRGREVQIRRKEGEEMPYERGKEGKKMEGSPELVEREGNKEREKKWGWELVGTNWMDKNKERKVRRKA